MTEDMKSRLLVLGLVGLFFMMWWYALKNSDLHNEPMEEQMESYTNLSAEETLDLLRDEDEVFLMDVHIPEQEHLAETDALIAFDEVSERITELPEDKTKIIVVYCRSGNMSKQSAEELVDMGYQNVYNLAGGMHGWKGAGLPLAWR